MINYIQIHNPCNVSRFKFYHKVQMINKDTEATTFTKLTLHKGDEKSFNRVDDNYHEFRDELLVIDSILT